MYSFLYSKKKYSNLECDLAHICNLKSRWLAIDSSYKQVKNDRLKMIGKKRKKPLEGGDFSIKT